VGTAPLSLEVSKPSNRSKAFREPEAFELNDKQQFQNLLTGLRHSGGKLGQNIIVGTWFQNLLTGLRHSGYLLSSTLALHDGVSKPSNRSKAFRVYPLSTVCFQHLPSLYRRGYPLNAQTDPKHALNS